MGDATMVKLVLLDVDGTITDENRLISTKAIDAIRKVQDRGILVSLVSGNAIPVMWGLRTFIGLESPVFGETGGAMAGREIEVFFPLEGPLNLYRELLDRGLVNDSVTNSWRSCSVSFTMPEENIPAVRRKVEEANLELIYTKFFWNILNRGQNKGFALETLAKRLGIGYSDILVMGDSMNDLPMFRKEVLKAVPRNADKNLKEKADIVSGLSCGDAAAEVLLNISGP